MAAAATAAIVAVRLKRYRELQTLRHGVDWNEYPHLAQACRNIRKQTARGETFRIHRPENKKELAFIVEVISHLNQDNRENMYISVVNSTVAVARTWQTAGKVLPVKVGNLMSPEAFDELLQKHRVCSRPHRPRSNAMRPST
jgi:hypothetical protein